MVLPVLLAGSDWEEAGISWPCKLSAMSAALSEEALVWELGGPSALGQGLWDPERRLGPGTPSFPAFSSLWFQARKAQAHILALRLTGNDLGKLLLALGASSV